MTFLVKTKEYDETDIKIYYFDNEKIYALE